MQFLFKKCLFILLISSPLFAQSEIREQGLLTNDPYWRQALGGAVLSIPSVQAQSAVVALDGGNIRAYSAIGTPMWNYSARGRISPYVTRSREGTSYFSRTTGILIALNRSGRELWRRDIGSPLASGVISGWDGRLFVPVEGKILCYTASGNLLWTYVFDSPYAITPKLDRGGGIILALENNEIYRIDHFGNAHLWGTSNSPACLLSIESSRILVLYRDGTMEILGTAEEWFVSAQEDAYASVLPRLPASPIAAVDSGAAVSGSNIAAVLDNGQIAFVSLEERRIIWTGDTHIREILRSGGRPVLEAEMISDERGIYILSIDGATGFTYDGRRLWFTLLQNAASIPAFGDDGVLYSGGRDWILYAYKIEDRFLPSRAGFYGPEPEGSYNLGRPQAAFTPNIPYFENELRTKLAQIELAINAGRIGAQEAEWTSFLLSVSAGQELLQYRLAAIRLLGRIGSRETIPWLVNIFNRDTEPSIKAAAAAAIGEIGVDPDGIAIQAFLNTVIYGLSRNEQVLAAIASATGALCRFSGPPLSETGIRILSLLSAASMPPFVRQQAQREMASLR